MDLGTDLVPEVEVVDLSNDQGNFSHDDYEEHDPPPLLDTYEASTELRDYVYGSISARKQNDEDTSVFLSVGSDSFRVNNTPPV